MKADADRDFGGVDSPAWEAERAGAVVADHEEKDAERMEESRENDIISGKTSGAAPPVEDDHTSYESDVCETAQDDETDDPSDDPRDVDPSDAAVQDKNAAVPQL